MYEGDIVIMDKDKASLTAEIIYYNGAYRIKDEFTSNIAIAHHCLMYIMKGSLK